MISPISSTEIQIMNIFKKRDIFQVKSTPVDPRAMPEPQNATDYINRGMAYYARHQYDFAEDDLRRATAMDPNSVDAFYTLGMVYKALQRKDEAVKVFKTSVDLLDSIHDENKSHYAMLRRLALGHINEITIGDWNLEKEIWQHI
jgi:tetratricopeptide (TPR) repeat protein